MGGWWPSYCDAMDCAHAALLDGLAVLFMLACMLRMRTLVAGRCARIERPWLRLKYALAVLQVFLCIAFFAINSMLHRMTTPSQDINLTAQGVAWAFYAAILLDDGETAWLRLLVVARGALAGHVVYQSGAPRIERYDHVCLASVHSATLTLGCLALLPAMARRPSDAASPYDHASLTSRLLYLWVSPFVTLGLRRRFEMADIPPLPRVDHTASASHAFQSALLRERRRSSPSFFRLLRQLYGWQVVGFGLWSACNKLLSLASPFLIKEFLEWAEHPTPSRGYVLAGAICGQAVLSALSGSQYGLAWTRFDIRLRAGLMAAIYGRTLELSASEKAAHGIGRLTNYVSVDLGRLVGMPGSVFDMVLIPMEIAIALYLLGREVSYAFVAGLVVLGVMLPIQTVLGATLQRVTRAMLSFRDDRVEWSSMLLQGVRVLKLLAWTDVYLEKMQAARSLEMQRLRVRKYLDALCVVFWASTPVIVQSSVFVAVIYAGHDLTAANAFTAIALLDRLIFPMNYFPWIINGFLEARVSALRLRAFLFPTARPSAAILEAPDGGRTTFLWRDCEFAWTASNDETRDLSTPLLTPDATMFEVRLDHLTLQKGDVLVLTGPVGCGKTSLLLALLGEMPLVHGDRFAPRGARVSYAPQTPWLFPASIRRNVTLVPDDDHIDDALYEKVLSACCLDVDFSSQPLGDRTLLSEDGANLSGGQRLRVGLARALYQRAALYLLDDCLSGLDTLTATNVLSRLHTVLPDDAALVLATHAVGLLGSFRCSAILVLDQGRIAQLGTYDELATTGTFHALLQHIQGSDARANDCVSDDVAITAHEAEASDATETEEHRENGAVAASVWRQYASAMGWHVALGLFLAVVAMQVTRNGLDYWVASYVSGHAMPAMTFANGLLILTGVNIAAVACRAFLFAYGGLRAANRLYASLVQHLFHAPLAFFHVTPTGRILNRLSGDTYGVDESLPFILNICIKDAAEMLGTLCILLLTTPLVLLLLLPLSLVYGRVQQWYRPTSRHVRRLDAVAQSPLLMHFHATLNGLSVLRGLQCHMRWYHEYLTLLNNSQRMSFLSANASAWFGLRLDALGVVLTSAIGVYAAVMSHLGAPVPSGTLGLLLIYALPIVGKCNAILGSLIATEQNMIAVERVLEYASLLPEVDGASPMLPTWPSNGVVRYDNVRVAYGDDNQAALGPLTISLRAKEKVGICGRTGAGKSSFLHALFRAMPYAGRITIDNVDIASMSLSTLRSALCFVPQEAMLFRGTLRSNLDPFGDADDSAIWDALRRCCLDAVVRSWPLQLETPVTGDDDKLSRGQAALINIARAVLRKSKVVCIDEATASIDHATEAIVQETLRSVFEDATVLTVAHRMHTILNCDRVLVLDHGHVVEWDTPAALLSNPAGQFTKLVQPAATSPSTLNTANR
ncbi:hypothetical protein SDRG_01405 [Saprolegnia diclina VS20]|uniref:ABC-type xenobiotic transporter n=1 Tax=Saprolegnia diclina (strain VS20) TaxID=1156394 RepID=T0SET2_SAPDV|nr:hypothetical protein SDRG_01405 [Saprolegnia diclina VS20]EQC41437.1 hypothetical protein SDRG_01405 [Saprolegnia diclina VS20]|eukprot:XP_008605151.1 hypothetical protein SDRG_01405 [Saprolegnia diclina VS20]